MGTPAQLSLGTTSVEVTDPMPLSPDTAGLRSSQGERFDSFTAS